MNIVIKKQILFAIIFIFAGIVALQIPVTHLVGSRASFTAFDSFAPIAGGFLGGVFGVISVFIIEILQFFIKGAQVLDTGTIIRFFPILFATIYFAKKSRINLILPMIAIAMFIFDPVGRQVWYFSLFWLIPIVCYFFQERFLLARSLGATFTAHAVGGALWITFLHIPKAAWIGLIPIVAFERLSFALGMALFYVLVNNLIGALMKAKIVPFSWPVDLKYVWFKLDHESQKINT